MVQIFDSWASELAPQDFDIFSAPYINRIIEQACPRTTFSIILHADMPYVIPQFASSEAPQDFDIFSAPYIKRIIKQACPHATQDTACLY